MANDALLPLQRDVNLTSFHALGKLLYNKRKGDKDAEDDSLPAAPPGAQLGAADSPGSIGQVAAECAPDLLDTPRLFRVALTKGFSSHAVQAAQACSPVVCAPD